MAIREYECEPCGFRTERIEFTPDDNALWCPRCVREHGAGQNIPMVRVAYSRSSFALKGSGWCRPATYQAPRRGTDL